MGTLRISFVVILSASWPQQGNVICAGVNYLMSLGHPSYQFKKVE